MMLIKNEDGTFDLNMSIRELAIIKTWSLMDQHSWIQNVEHMSNIQDPHIDVLVQNGFANGGTVINSDEIFDHQNRLFRELDREVRELYQEGDLCDN